MTTVSLLSVAIPMNSLSSGFHKGSLQNDIRRHGLEGKSRRYMYGEKENMT